MKIFLFLFIFKYIKNIFKYKKYGDTYTCTQVGDSNKPYIFTRNKED